MNTNITDLYNRLKEQLCRIYSLDFRNLMTSRAHQELNERTNQLKLFLNLFLDLQCIENKTLQFHILKLF
jgi:hypothetical protein